MPDHYHDRSEQVQAIGRARHWLERLAQLAHFEHVVLRMSRTVREEPGRPAGSNDSRQPPRQ